MIIFKSTNPRNPNPVSENDQPVSSLIRPRQRVSGLFHGWGPRLGVLGLGLAMAASGQQARAASDPGLTCAEPDRPAVVRFTAALDSSPIAEQYNITGTTEVLVTIGADGALQEASVAKASGYPFLDRQALRFVRTSSNYVPEIRNCSPVPGSYLVRVDF